VIAFGQRCPNEVIGHVMELADQYGITKVAGRRRL
jgi:hypothetical protein